MIDSISDINRLRKDQTYKKGDTPNQLGENRSKVLSILSELSNAHTAFVWLLETKADGFQMRLSYVSPENKRVQSHFDVFFDIKESDLENCFFLVEEFTKTNLLGANQEIVDVIELPRLIPGDITNTNQSEYLNWTIGFLVYCESKKRRLNSYEVSATQFVAHRLAAVIEQSRLRRIASASRMVNEILYGRPKTEKLLLETMNSIAGIIGTECSLAVGRTHREEIKILAKTNESLDQIGTTEVRELLRLLSRDSQFSQIKRLSSVDLRNVFSGDVADDLELRNGVAIPVIVPGRQLNPKAAFIRLGDENNALTKSEVCEYILFSFNKSSPVYVGNHFSSTDLYIYQSAVEQITAYLSASNLKRQIDGISKFFDREIGSGLLESKSSRVDCAALLSDVVSLSMFSARVVGEEVKVSSNPKSDYINKSDKDKLNIERFCSKYFLKYYKNKGRDVKFAILDESGGVYLLVFHVPTKQDSSRFVVFRFENDHITDTSWQIIKHFVQEVHLYFRHQDAMKERANVLAQIGHAVMGPLSSIKAYVRPLNMKMKRARRTKQAWEALIDDTRMFDQLYRVVFLTEQARVLAESARLLVKDLRPSDIKQNGRFYPNRALSEIRISLDPELDRKNLVWELTSKTDNEQFVVGDPVLLWISVYNLIENAVKYSAPSTNVVINSGISGDYWEFKVANIGGFIAESERKKIFEIYERGIQSDTLNRRLGTGIGINVVHNVLNAHTNDFVFDCSSVRRLNSNDATTTFWFKMPVYPSRTKKLKN